MKFIGTWKGRDFNELSREELLDVIEYLGKELKEVREDRDRWFEAGDVVKYLMNKPA